MEKHFSTCGWNDTSNNKSVKDKDFNKKKLAINEILNEKKKSHDTVAFVIFWFLIKTFLLSVCYVS